MKCGIYKSINGLDVFGLAHWKHKYSDNPYAAF